MLRGRGIEVLSMQEWRSGDFIESSDEEILRATGADERVLVTQDVKTIPRKLNEFAALGIEHAGVIFVSSKTFGPGALTPVAVSIEALLAEMADTDWRNCVRFLPKLPK